MIKIQKGIFEGPATLKINTVENTDVTAKVAVAKQAIIEFSHSKLEQSWSEGDGNLLVFAESHGLQPEFACRSGQCGSCKVGLESGCVTHPQDVSASVASQQKKQQQEQKALRVHLRVCCL